MNKITNIHQINSGDYIPPVKRVTLFSANEWETFIGEWLDVCPTKYFRVEILGGPGDKGRDVIGYLSDPGLGKNYMWDCYQCKHYRNALTPSDILTDLGKILYYSYIGDYSIPQNYYIVGPCGIGGKLSNLIDNKDLLKKEIKDKWDTKCKNGITSTKNILLEGKFADYVDNFDYSIIKNALVKDVLIQHEAHMNHSRVFGAELRERSELEPPTNIRSNELVYINKLRDAYNSEGGRQYKDITEVSGKHEDHFLDARLGFYYAEQLDRFYRDSLPEGTFDKFVDQIYKGVKRLNYETYPNGFVKVVAFEQESTHTHITSSPLLNVSIIEDRIGICHHLANNNKLTWTQ